MCLSNTHWQDRNYRNRLMQGIRRRIEKARFGRHLMYLWTWLLEAGEMPA